jgi:hypothetical protein
MSQHAVQHVKALTYTRRVAEGISVTFQRRRDGAFTTDAFVICTAATVHARPAHVDLVGADQLLVCERMSGSSSSSRVRKS